MRAINPVAAAFRKRHFPGLRASDWNDWRWQLRNSFKDLAQLEGVLRLSSSERAALAEDRKLPTQITPYYASLLDPDNADTPLRRTMVMTTDEFTRSWGEADDPRDVLLSGGDPLLLSDDKLEWLLSRLRAIKHVELIRIGTKVPAVLPQRITPALTRMLKRHHPFWMSVHFMHPDELTLEVARACAALADAGIPLGSQTVVVAGVNDDVATMTRLMHGLVKIRVKPYYLFQCDPVTGTAHFRTPVTKSLEIVRGLPGHTSGYAVPTFAIDAPGGGGKVPPLPDDSVRREGNDIVLPSFDGNLYRYPDVHK